MIDFIRIVEERQKILKRREGWIKKLEEFTKTKIELNKEIRIECDDPLTLLRVKEVIKAFGRGFDFNSALLLLDESYFLDSIDIKLYGKTRNRQRELKGRVIGKEGKVKRMIEKKTETKIAVYGKTVSIIGKWKNLKVARKAVELILNGAMHSTVYRFLEKQITNL